MSQSQPAPAPEAAAAAPKEPARARVVFDGAVRAAAAQGALEAGFPAAAAALAAGVGLTVFPPADGPWEPIEGEVSAVYRPR